MVLNNKAERKKAHQFEVDLANRVARYIQSCQSETPTLDEMGAAFHMSPFHLQRTFKRIVGITPRQYAESHRLKQLKKRLRGGEKVTSALYNAGYGSSSRLYERAPEKLGMTPAVYSKGGTGMHITYSIHNCHLGRVLVAMTPRGICAVHIGRNDSELEDVLRLEYPAATLERNTGPFCDWVAGLLGHLNGNKAHLDLPLDIQGTAFQWKVWQALMDIPYGETRTYGEIAAAIGHPRAARAVAEAVHKNPTAILIPCHRAGRQDGLPTRYYSERSAYGREKLIETELRNRDHCEDD
ncbi:MAG: methylated-DNA--[protein]-cysteine S-methyltransferase [Anaerolineae bacterium]|nr:methylated-DNA--[protein]-cysteine S-methyltransferase [Anaerolineae bacterium]